VGNIIQFVLAGWSVFKLSRLVRLWGSWLKVVYEIGSLYLTSENVANPDRWSTFRSEHLEIFHCIKAKRQYLCCSMGNVGKACGTYAKELVHGIIIGASNNASMVSRWASAGDGHISELRELPLFYDTLSKSAMHLHRNSLNKAFYSRKCQLLRIEGVAWSAQRIPTAVFSVFETGAATVSSK
jgi:hypothetical protein